jgi:acetamidase/formamidase
LIAGLTSANWVFMGFDEDLNEAMKIAVRETVNFLAEQKTVPMSREEAYALTSIVGDCRVSQVGYPQGRSLPHPQIHLRQKMTSLNLRWFNSSLRTQPAK